MQTMYSMLFVMFAALIIIVGLEIQFNNEEPAPVTVAETNQDDWMCMGRTWFTVEP